MPLLSLRACTVDLATGRLGSGAALSAVDRRLLAYFVAHPGRVIARGELLREVWHWRATRDTRAVHAAIRRLRTRIEADPAQPDHLFTVHGVGYRFVSEAAPLVVPQGAAVAQGAVVDRVQALLAETALVVVDAPAWSGGSTLARALQALPGFDGHALVDLDEVPVAATVFVVGRALSGVGGDVATFAAVLRGAGRSLLVLDHAEPAHLAVLMPYLDPAPRVSVVAIGRALHGVPSRRVALPARPAPTLPDSALAREALRWLAEAPGGLPPGLWVQLGAPWEGVEALQERGLVARTAGSVGAGPSVRALVAAVPGGTWLIPTATSRIAALRQRGRQADERVLEVLLPRLIARATSGEDWLRIATVGKLLGIASLRRMANEAAVATGEGEASRCAAYDLMLTAPNAAQAGRAAAAAIEGVSPVVEMMQLAVMYTERLHAGERNEYRAIAPHLVAAADGVGHFEISRSVLGDIVGAAQQEGRPREALAAVSELRNHCRRHGYAAYEVQFGATELLARAALSEPYELNDEADRLLSLIRQPEAGTVRPVELLRLASVLMELEREPEARALLTECLEASVRRGLTLNAFSAVNNLALVDWLEGAWGRAARRLHEALAMAPSAGGHRAVALSNLATLTEDESLLAEACATAPEDPRIQGSATVRALAMPSAVADPEGVRARVKPPNPGWAEAVPYYDGVLRWRLGDAAPAEALVRQQPRSLVALLGRRWLLRKLSRTPTPSR